MVAVIVLLVCAVLPATSMADEPWCWNADQVVVQVDGDQVHIDHLFDLLNCCPDPITYRVEIGDVTILVEENSESVCNCNCCFNLGVMLDDVPSGFWILRYRWFDIETGDWAEREFQIEIPDLGQGYIPFVAAQERNGCLQTAEVPESRPSIDRRSWGRIKSIYR